jgi:GntR family transcriptional repressor for pyruvate dehydrogenase complex
MGGPDAGRDIFSPLGRATAAEELADRLLAAVAVGVYLPGERFPSERDLAVSFAVSRATVREALRMLRGSAVVEIRLGRTGGAFVRPLPPGATDSAVRRAFGGHGPELAEVFDLRELVESLVARTAAERRTAADIERIREALAFFRTATAQRDQHGGDQALHEAILDAAHNAQLSALSHRVLAAASLGLPAEPFAADMYLRARREHTSLVRAVVDGDADRAGVLARRHFRISTENVQRAVQAASRD